MDPSTRPAATAADPIRVMIVDDSAVIRGLVTRSLEGDPSIRVVASVVDGKMAIDKKKATEAVAWADYDVR